MDGPGSPGLVGPGGGEAMLAADRAAAAPSMSGQHRDVAGRGAWIVRALAPAEVNRLVFIGSANENDTLLDFLQTGAWCRCKLTWASMLKVRSGTACSACLSMSL